MDTLLDMRKRIEQLEKKTGVRVDLRYYQIGVSLGRSSYLRPAPSAYSMLNGPSPGSASETDLDYFGF
ncbi:hypothetical protein P691DRAFT_804977 [Macrolepiota fuliginosa MF-IS2]|uniref:Uncharacterized protein n=1 Tax=Macrolepiota fuliginosa MF-IS2 TaxID=1400762 RepID=A0A9P5X8C7_9AGAR|nr:hypothetical protein P691DRAFT_804977 [Macrolepiota fuliginosa MF-IS2]